MRPAPLALLVAAVTACVTARTRPDEHARSPGGARAEPAMARGEPGAMARGEPGGGDPATIARGEAGPALVDGPRVIARGALPDLYAAPANLRDMRLLGSSGGHYAFSPDSAWVVFIGAEGLVAIRPDGGDRRVLADQASFFSIAPDSTHYELRIAALDGADRGLAVASGTYTMIARATADSRRVIVHVHRDGDAMALFAVDVDAGLSQRLTRDLPGWSNFYLSADGRHALLGVPGKGDARSYELYALALP